MSGVTYSKSSPYAKTPSYGFFLDVATLPTIPKNSGDIVFKITAIYRYRPDLLASDLYGDPNLWWVFAMRNPNTIKDPIFDFLPGATIYLPKKETLQTVLGL